MSGQDKSLGPEFLKLISDISQLPNARPNREVVAKLQDMAARWDAAGQHFYAGFSLSRAVQPAWGDADLVESCSREAVRAYQRGAAARPTVSIEHIACLRGLGIEVGQNYIDVEPSIVRTNLRKLNEELAQALLQTGQQETDARARAGLLIHGFFIETDFQGDWRRSFPEYEVSGNSIETGTELIRISVPSAFQLLVRAGDYIAADTVANDSPPEAFNSPGLRGWRAAARGFLYPERAVEEFTRAANEFAANTREESLKHTGHWTSANVDLWAKYFRARAYVSQVAQTPDQTSALLKQARDALKGTESGWGNPQVTCFRFLLTILDQALDPDGHDSVDDLRESFISRMRFSGLDETDHLALQFFDRITAGFADLRAGPRIALISDNLSTALNALVRIPLFGSGEARELSAQIGMQAETVLLGNVRTWMHRTLSSISDEIVLQKVLLYLIQAELPLFAQNRQGVAEYGKDIVELVALGGQNVLKMYQVKAGDITVPKWRAARAELEDMFLADMSDVQLPATPDVREGILIYNGHILPLTEPLVEGWLKEQKCDHDRTFTIMGLDDIVTWIVDHRLVSEFRAILTALGIPIT